jgi:hypothetical protein
MIRLATLIALFEAGFLSLYQNLLLPSQLKALAAMKACRTSASPQMQAHCPDCDQRLLVPHSCGHRNCPHCQHHESQRWIERQLARQVPAAYFLVTFTLPAQLRSLAWANQRTLYELMIRASWETLRTFARNDRRLQGEAGAIAVLHTHSRALDYHPHVHLVMPGAALDTTKRLWRTKGRRQRRGGYLFNEKALAKVFRAKLLAAITGAGLALPPSYPKDWVVDCQHVGTGEKALVYLGRYLYRGVIREQDIVSCENGQVTFRYRHAKDKRWAYRTLPGAEFLALVLQHVLPKGFRRTRNFGFLHPNSQRAIRLLQWLFGLDPKRRLIRRPRPGLICPACGTPMIIVQTRLPPRAGPPPTATATEALAM